MLDGFFMNSPALMVVVDAELRVMKANPAFERRVGPGVVGGSILDLCPPADQDRIRTVLGECAQHGARSFGASLGLAPGEWVVEVDAERRLLLIMIREGTTRERLEKELAAAQKLEAVGQLTSGIAHELNTPIQFVGDNLSFIGDSLREIFQVLHAVERHETAKVLLTEHPEMDLPFLIDELPRAVEQACEGVQRLAELVRGMKEFAHQDREVTPTDLNRALERTLTVARNEWKYAADVETAFEPLPMVPCQASAIRQVFLNLICNAAQANAERNERTGRAKGSIRVSTWSDGQAVTVTISDTGTGIPEAARARIFEPFFTTKPVGKGTGQGLAISRTIVCEQHGGQLDFESELGVGATFRVRLPLRPAAH
ncbi:MAG: ATP-binding protein [Archangium sp.]|nr:ATP-binding protein [Archangium sp.]